MNNEITTIASADLEDVTGGFGAFLTKLAPMLGGLFGGGTNANAQIGNNQRSAQGNTGPVSLGDNSPVTVNQPPAGGQ